MRRLLSAFSKSDTLPLAIFAASYVAAISYLSMLRYNDFFTSNWDFGIMQQMLWTTLHGRVLFDTADYSTSGFLSYLEVNSSYVALPVSYVYALYQSPVTLFVLQSLAVSLASFPLYRIVLRSGHDRRVAFTFVLLYLFGMATLSSVFYDFHWESFIPAEFFSFYLFFSSGRFRLAAAVLVLGSATLEIFPVLAAAVVVYFALSEHRGLTENNAPSKQKQCYSFLAACAASLICILILQKTLIDVVIGMAPGVSVHASSSYFVQPVLVPSVFFASSVYWLLLLASLGFLPLLSGRSLVMSLPWFAESVFLYPKFSIMFGYQYGFISLPPLLVSSVIGAGRLKDDGRLQTQLMPLAFVSVSFLLLLSGDASVFLRQEGYALSLPLLMSFTILFMLCFRRALHQGDKGTVPQARRAPHRHLLTTLLLSVIFFNLVMGPLNTSNFGVNSGYNLLYSSNPSFRYTSHVASMIEPGSTVLASDNLFPLVDQNAHAYSAMWLPFSRSLMPHLPFNTTALPDYVFADSSQFPSMPSFIVHDIFNSSVYGLVAYVYYGEYPGTVYLFRLGYAGTTAAFMASGFASSYSLDYHNLRTGLSGTVEKYPGSLSGSVIESRNGYAISPSDLNSLNIWYGPYMTLLPGNYTITFNLRIESGSSNVSEPVLYMNGNGFGLPYFYSVMLNASAAGSGFSNVTFRFSCTEPASLTEFRGYLLLDGRLPAGTVILNYIFLREVPA